VGDHNDHDRYADDVRIFIVSPCVFIVPVAGCRDSELGLSKSAHIIIDPPTLRIVGVIPASGES
jgi:hypothetical protein